MKGKRSQITMFVILGLIIFILLIIILAVKEAARPKTNTLEGVLNELKTGSIKNHITDCVKQLTADAVQSIGFNGGVIYDFEGGTIPFRAQEHGRDYLNFTYENKTYFVSYALKKNKACPVIDYSIPAYPHPSVALDQLVSTYNTEGCRFLSSYDGFFGESRLNKLCYSAKESSCEPFAKGDQLGLTIQRQIEDYIASRLGRCVNFSAFARNMEADIREESEPVVDLVMRDSELIINVQYPVTIAFEGGEPVTRITEYQTSMNLALARTYNFLYDILRRDAQRYDFDLLKEYVASEYWREGLSVIKMRDKNHDASLPARHDNIIQVIDRESVVNRKPLTIRAAVENRRPVLASISNQTLDLDDDIYVVKIPLQGYDPDDLGITYYVSSYFSPRVAEDDGRLEQQYQVMLELHVSRYDYGMHNITLLVLDDSGLFDYQLFWVNITDRGFDRQPTDSCVADCSENSSIPDCDEWCFLAGNPCFSECQRKFCTLSEDAECYNCVSNIYYSEAPGPITCSALGESACVDAMPGCFWVVENQSSQFRGSCYDVNELSQANPPAYIIT